MFTDSRTMGHNFTVIVKIKWDDNANLCMIFIDLKIKINANDNYAFWFKTKYKTSYSANTDKATTTADIASGIASWMELFEMIEQNQAAELVYAAAENVVINCTNLIGDIIRMYRIRKIVYGF